MSFATSEPAMTTQHVFPPLPEIGRSESYYAHGVHKADREGNFFAHEAFKVGQYIILGLDPRLTWEQKLKYFQHALRRHCNPPPLPDDETWNFFASLGELIREHAGAEALRIVSCQDDVYAARQQMGQRLEKIAEDAEEFFAKFIPEEHCPQWFNEEDFAQLRLIRDQWV